MSPLLPQLGRSQWGLRFIPIASHYAKWYAHVRAIYPIDPATIHSWYVNQAFLLLTNDVWKPGNHGRDGGFVFNLQILNLWAEMGGWCGWGCAQLWLLMAKHRMVLGHLQPQCALNLGPRRILDCYLKSWTAQQQFLLESHNLSIKFYSFIYETYLLYITHWKLNICCHLVKKPFLLKQVALDHSTTNSCLDFIKMDDVFKNQMDLKDLCRVLSWPLHHTYGFSFDIPNLGSCQCPWHQITHIHIKTSLVSSNFSWHDVSTQDRIMMTNILPIFSNAIYLLKSGLFDSNFI